jgi:hypothetical protein
MREHPTSIYELSPDVFVRVRSFVSGRAVAYLQVHNFLGSIVDEAVPIASSCLEASAHAGPK